jgi:hypothetical protein
MNPHLEAMAILEERRTRQRRLFTRISAEMDHLRNEVQELRMHTDRRQCDQNSSQEIRHPPDKTPE